MNKIIYLDFNILMDIFEREDNELKSKILYLKENGYIFPFGTAHLEEIATPVRKEKQQQKNIQKNKKLLSNLSDEYSIFPHPVTHLTQNDSVDKCYTRVVGKNKKNLTKTDDAEKSQQKTKEKAKEIKSCLPELKIFQRELSSATPDKISNHICFTKLCAIFGVKLPYSPNIRDYEELIFERIFLIFEILGYASEKDSRAGAAMHDLTHTISASVADFFVTNDKKLFKKSTAAYNFLKINTKVISKDDFIKYEFDI